MFVFEIYKECYDPISEAICVQLGNPDFNDYPSIETIIVTAIDEKYSRLPDRYKRLISLKLQGYTFIEIGEKVNYSERQVRRIFKKMSVFSSFKPL